MVVMAVCMEGGPDQSIFRFTDVLLAQVVIRERSLDDLCFGLGIARVAEESSARCLLGDIPILSKMLCQNESDWHVACSVELQRKTDLLLRGYEDSELMRQTWRLYV
jgi:hypothetical protein